MSQLKNAVMSFLVEDEAASMVEYGLLVALIAVVVAGAAFLLGSNLKVKMTNASTCVASANSTACP